VFDKGSPTKIINVTSARNNGKLWYHCKAFLVYNDTTVDIKESTMSCLIIKGNATQVSGGRHVEAETGFRFKIGFIARGGGGVLKARITSASVGNLYNTVPSRF
jgi:hypothetical protein